MHRRALYVAAAVAALGCSTTPPRPPELPELPVLTGSPSERRAAAAEWLEEHRAEIEAYAAHAARSPRALDGGAASGVAAAADQPPSAVLRSTTLRWRDPNTDTTVWGERSARCIDAIVLAQHFSWWQGVVGCWPQTDGDANTIYSSAAALPDWPGCELLAIRLAAPTVLVQVDPNDPESLAVQRSGYSNVVEANGPCLDPPPERIRVTPEAPAGGLYIVLLALYLLARRRSARVR